MVKTTVWTLPEMVLFRVFDPLLDTTLVEFMGAEQFGNGFAAFHILKADRALVVIHIYLTQFSPNPIIIGYIAR